MQMRRLPSWYNYKDKPQRKGPQSESQKFFTLSKDRTWDLRIGAPVLYQLS